MEMEIINARPSRACVTMHWWQFEILKFIKAREILLNLFYAFMCMVFDDYLCHHRQIDDQGHQKFI